jgi:hypothetical protein
MSKVTVGKITVRKADTFDIPILQQELAKTDWEQVDLKRSLVWIAEYNEVPFAFIALRLVWQIEPMFVFKRDGIPSHALKKGVYMMYREAEKFLSDREQNTTGIHWSFMHTLKESVGHWARKMGWVPVYRQAKGKLWAKGWDKKVEDKE